MDLDAPGQLTPGAKFFGSPSRVGGEGLFQFLNRLNRLAVGVRGLSRSRAPGAGARCCSSALTRVSCFEVMPVAQFPLQKDDFKAGYYVTIAGQNPSPPVVFMRIS